MLIWYHMSAVKMVTTVILDVNKQVVVEIVLTFYHFFTNALLGVSGGGRVK